MGGASRRLPLLFDLKSHAPQIFTGFGVIRIESQGLLEAHRRFTQLPLIDQEDAQPVMRIGIIWVEAQGLLVMEDGSLRIALRGQGVGEIGVGVGVLGVETRRLLKVLRRLRQFTLHPKRATQTVVRARVVWPRAQRFAEM